MKKKIIIIVIAMLASFSAAAQSLNPLNYSGRMYLEAIEIYETPRYISYEDHAIVSRKSRIPVMQVTKVDMDFGKGTVITDGSELKVKVRTVKKYDTDRGWVVVLYFDYTEIGDKGELVWPEFGKPYLQEITQLEGRVTIARMLLSKTPYAATEVEALLDILQGMGTMN